MHAQRCFFFHFLLLFWLRKSCQLHLNYSLDHINIPLPENFKLDFLQKRKRTKGKKTQAHACVSLLIFALLWGCLDHKVVETIVEPFILVCWSLKTKCYFVLFFVLHFCCMICKFWLGITYERWDNYITKFIAFILLPFHSFPADARSSSLC